MGGKASYKLVFEGKVDSSGQRAKLTCRLSSHINVITNQGGTSVNQSGVGGKTKYKCRGRCLSGGNIQTVLDGPDH